MRQVVFPVASHGWHVEAFDIIKALFSVAIHHIVGSSLVISLVDLYVQHILAHKNLVGHTQHLVFPIFVEDDDVVDVRTVANKLILLESRSHKSLVAIDVEFLVRFNHFGRFDGLEVAYFSASRMVVSIFVDQELEPFHGDIRHVRQVVLDAFQFLFDARHQLVGFVFAEF